MLSYSNDNVVTSDISDALTELITDLTEKNGNTVEKEHFATTINDFLKSQSKELTQSYSGSLKHKNIKEIDVNEFLFSLFKVFLTKISIK